MDEKGHWPVLKCSAETVTSNPGRRYAGSALSGVGWVTAGFPYRCIWAAKKSDVRITVLIVLSSNRKSKVFSVARDSGKHLVITTLR